MKQATSCFRVTLGCLLVIALAGCKTNSTDSQSLSTSDKAKPAAAAPAAPAKSAAKVVAKSDAEVLLIETLDAQKLGYERQWSLNLNVSGGDYINQAIVLGDLLVIIEKPTNVVTAISVKDGTRLWSRRIGKPVEQLFTPFRYQDSVLINTELYLYYLDANTGRQTNMAKLDSMVISSPVVADTMVVFGTVDGRVIAHELKSNQLRWAYQLTSQIVAKPQFLGLNVFAADSSGVYAMLNALTGAVQWKHKTWGAVTADPVLTNQGIFMACEDHQLYSINRSTGQDRWIYRTQVALKESPTVIGNTVYLNVPGTGLVALDQASGEVPLWTLPEMGKPFALQDQLLMIHRPRKIEVVEVATGKSVLQVPVTGLQTVLAGPGKSQILVASNGRIVRLDPRP